MTNKKLVLITNIPSPYNLDLYSALASRFELEVYFFDKIEKERSWRLNIYAGNYKAEVFRSDLLGRLFHLFNRNLYFNFHCISIALLKKSDYFILGGNYYAPNSILSLLILKLRGQKVFWYGERLFPVSSKIKFLLKRILISPVNNCTRALFAIGETAKRSYEAYGYRKKIVNTPYAIDPKYFPSENTGEHALQDNRVVILSSGSLIERKGFDIAIEALNLLPGDLKEKISFWILGDGPLQDALQKKADPLLDIRFLGFIAPELVHDVYNKASIFLFTSRYDGWGVVINEAMAAGLPVIVTNSCGASEYIDAKGGFVVDTNPVIIKQQIEYLLLHKEERVAFGKYNFERSKLISADRIAQKMSDTLLESYI